MLQKKVDPTVTKAEIFQLLYHKGLIGPKGEPTKEALDSGYVKDYTESMDLTYTDFLILYPVFARFSADHFKDRPFLGNGSNTARKDFR